MTADYLVVFIAIVQLSGPGLVKGPK